MVGGPLRQRRLKWGLQASRVVSEVKTIFIILLRHFCLFTEWTFTLRGQKERGAKLQGLSHTAEGRHQAGSGVIAYFDHHIFLQFTFYILKNTYVKNISLKNSQFHPEVLDDAVRITLYYIWPLNPCFLKGQWQVREHRASAHPHSHRNSVLSESNRGLNQLPQGSPFLFRRMYDKLWLFRPGY